MRAGSCIDNSNVPICDVIVKDLDIAGIADLPDLSASLKLACSHSASFCSSSLIQRNWLAIMDVKYFVTPSDATCGLFAEQATFSSAFELSRSHDGAWSVSRSSALNNSVVDGLA